MRPIAIAVKGGALSGLPDAEEIIIVSPDDLRVMKRLEVPIELSALEEVIDELGAEVLIASSIAEELMERIEELGVKVILMKPMRLDELYEELFGD